YVLEAERQRWFARLHEGDSHIRVPQVIAERSSQRVLTSELVHGESLEHAAAADEALRRHYCEVLWRFVYKGNLVGGMFNADPHPGNYLFRDDGTIAFLDYGCVQPIGEPRLSQARELHRAACAGDEAAFRIGAKVLTQTRGGAYEAWVQRYVRRCFEPLFSSPFRISREYVTEVVRGVQDIKDHVLGGDGSLSPMPPGMVFMNRLQFGFYSVLARLDAEADYRAVEDRFFAEAGLV
ncbi:MAG: AarF/UbiB family protein, partial [Polyangiales bacterium]